MQEIQNHLVEIIKKLIKEEDDRILNVRGGRGYGTGHPYPVKSDQQVNQNLGSPGPYGIDDDEDEKPTAVKISKAFKRE